MEDTVAKSKRSQRRGKTVRNNLKGHLYLVLVSPLLFNSINIVTINGLENPMKIPNL